VNNRRRRLKAVELALTPRQTVLLWIRTATNGTTEDCIRHTLPRRAIADSILKNVTNAMKGEHDAVVERAVTQARQEADTLYNLCIAVNISVLESTSQRKRECRFLFQYLRGITYSNIGPHSEEEIRRTVLFFIEAIFSLDGAVSEVCAEHFGGQPLLFGDSVQQLREQLDVANTILECFNLLADKLNFKELTEKSIRETLEPDITKQHFEWLDLARVETLAEFGDEADRRAEFSRALRDWHDRQAQARAKKAVSS
jgi:hypothetical protein